MGSMSIEDVGKLTLEDGRQYVDITQLIIEKCQRLKNDVVVKSPSFSLFEGTHALEVMNDKLDSGLIQLSKEEIDFDCSASRTINEVLGISDAMFRSVFVWLNNNSLPVTVLSCQYIETLLVNYTSNVRGGIESCKFYKNEADIDMSSIDVRLVHQVLRAVSLGVLHFVRLCLTLGQSGVVYEEEDINTQTMDLDIISLIDSEQIVAEIQLAMVFLQTNFPGAKDSVILLRILDILRRLIDLPFYLTVKIPDNSNGKTVDMSTLNVLLNNSKFLQENVEYLNSIEILPGCFSMGVQKRLDNRSPTRDLVASTSEDYSSLSQMIQDFQNIFQIAFRSNTLQVKNFALNFSHLPHHIIARAFFPLFLIRDDRTVLGVEQFDDFLIKDLTDFSCLDSEILTTENLVLKHKVNEILGLINATFFDYLNTMSQNPCRQRQHLSRQIVLFDALQANVESLEVEINDVFESGDLMELCGKTVPALPLASWVYYQKLDIMLQFALRGLELDVYKVWEYESMYWYATYLVDHIDALISRVIVYNEQKIEQIKSMAKKLKNKKGDQKARYKEKYQFKLNNYIPKLSKINESLQCYKLLYQIYKATSQLQLINLKLLKSKNLAVQPSFPFVKNESMLYELRMKPFSTVGDPVCPTYKDYLTQVASVSIPRDQLKKTINDSIKTILAAIENSDYDLLGMKLSKSEWLKWVKELQRSAIAIQLSIVQNSEITKTHKVDDLKLTIEAAGYHRYFPLVKATSTA